MAPPWLAAPLVRIRPLSVAVDVAVHKENAGGVVAVDPNAAGQRRTVNENVPAQDHLPGREQDCRAGQVVGKGDGGIDVRLDEALT